MLRKRDGFQDEMRVGQKNKLTYRWASACTGAACSLNRIILAACSREAPSSTAAIARNVSA